MEMKKLSKVAQSKVFARDPRVLQKIIDLLVNSFGHSIIISQIQEASQGDFFVFATWWEDSEA